MVKDCHRGDWLIWLASKTKIDLKTLILAKVKCVRTVQHLMTDKRSLDALDIAEKFANGDASKDELTTATAVAYTANAVANAVAYSATFAATINDATINDAFTAAKKENQKQTADICREIFGDWLIETLIRK